MVAEKVVADYVDAMAAVDGGLAEDVAAAAAAAAADAVGYDVVVVDAVADAAGVADAGQQV